MIFIFHDNGNGDDDNAVCIVMIIRVPGVTGRLCEETLHWCPPRWLWTFVCPSMSDWLMDCVCLTERHFVFYFVLLLTCICQSDGLIFFFCLLFIIIFPKITPSSWLLFHILAFACPDTVALSLFGKHCPLALLHTSTFFLSAYPINLPVCLCPIFPYLPAVILCFVSFICGSHQTLEPDWFSCEQGCSGGPGTSSPGFEDPSHPVHCFSDPPTQHTLTHKNTRPLSMSHSHPCSLWIKHF